MSPLEACSNCNAVDYFDELETAILLEPFTPYREKNDFRQFNLPYQPFNVKGSSGDLLNVDFLKVTATLPVDENFLKKTLNYNVSQVCNFSNTPDFYINEESSNLEENKLKEINENFNGKIKTSPNDKPYSSTLYESFNDIKNVENVSHNEEKKKLETKSEFEDTLETLGKEAFDFSSFFPDESCISNYLEENVKTYQPFGNSYSKSKNDANLIENSQSIFPESIDIYNNNNNIHKDKEMGKEEIPKLPRFLTMPENDQRQCGNTSNSFLQSEPDLCCSGNEMILSCSPENKADKFLSKSKACEAVHSSIEKIESSNLEHISPSFELPKSKSLTHLSVNADCDETREPKFSFWKSQPNINDEFTRKYSMPKLKPILPKGNLLCKSVPSRIPKVTHTTEFLMSSDYKEPVDMPKDNTDHVLSHMMKLGYQKQFWSESLKNRSKFGPLPLAELVRTENKKKIHASSTKLIKPYFSEIDFDSYDIKYCKRQMGNKPKEKDNIVRKKSVLMLPALKPLLPAKKGGTKEFSQLKENVESRIRRNAIVTTTGNSFSNNRQQELKETTPTKKAQHNKKADEVNEILKRLINYSKNYLHFFDVTEQKSEIASPPRYTSVTHPRTSTPKAEREKSPIPKLHTSANKKTQLYDCYNSYSGLEYDSGVETQMSDVIKGVSDGGFTKSQIKNFEKSKTGASYEIFEKNLGNFVKSTPNEFKNLRNYVKNTINSSEAGLLAIRGITTLPSNCLRKKKKTELNKNSVSDKKTNFSQSKELVLYKTVQIWKRKFLKKNGFEKDRRPSPSDYIIPLPWSYPEGNYATVGRNDTKCANETEKFQENSFHFLKPRADTETTQRMCPKNIETVEVFGSEGERKKIKITGMVHSSKRKSKDSETELLLIDYETPRSSRREAEYNENTKSIFRKSINPVVTNSHKPLTVGSSFFTNFSQCRIPSKTEANKKPPPTSNVTPKNNLAKTDPLFKLPPTPTKLKTNKSRRRKNTQNEKKPSNEFPEGTVNFVSNRQCLFPANVPQITSNNDTTVTSSTIEDSAKCALLEERSDSVSNSFVFGCFAFPCSVLYIFLLSTFI